MWCRIPPIAIAYILVRLKIRKSFFCVNENNFMVQNILDNRVRFQGHAYVKRNVAKGVNYVIRKSDDTLLEDKYENLEQKEEKLSLIIRIK